MCCFPLPLPLEKVEKAQTIKTRSKQEESRYLIVFFKLNLFTFCLFSTMELKAACSGLPPLPALPSFGMVVASSVFRLYPAI